MKYIDRFLNAITMYRLLLYGLGVLVTAASVLSLFEDVLPFTTLALLASLGVALAACAGSNWALAKLYRVPANVESSYITALILVCIITPTVTLADLLTIAAAGVIAMAAKYVLAINQKHIFNPAAVAAVLVVMLGFHHVSWWVGTGVMLPLTLVFGLLIVRKIRRADLFFAYIVPSVLILAYLGIVVDQRTTGEVFAEMFRSWPLIFFSTVMLTEPLTTPPTRWGRVGYGVFVAVVMNSRWHLGALAVSPQLALVAGNLLSFALSPKQRPTLTLKEVVKMAPNIWDFIFTPSEKVRFIAGQYAEWTLAPDKADDRGNRRYFTIASAPHETDIHLGVKFYSPSSSFKEMLRAMQPGDTLMLGQVCGDFVLPTQPQPLLFLAGGIGVTPFRSMLHHLLQQKGPLDAVLVYSAARAEEVVYRDTIALAQSRGLRVIYVLGTPDNVPADWNAHLGYITQELLAKSVPDIAKRRAYISGPNLFVDASKKAVRSLGVPASSIVTDYFPGY